MNIGGVGRIRTAESEFCRLVPYHLATTPFLLFTLLLYTVAVTCPVRTPTVTWLQRPTKSLERETGLKPATSALARQRSIN